MRFGILGAADIARRYTGAALRDAEGSELVGLAARDRDRAAALAELLGVSAYDDYDAIIDDPSIDAVYIPLPIGLHATWALRAIRAGKHVLCEKSLAGSLPDALAILDAAGRAGVLVMENFMCTYHAQNLLVRDAIREGGIGSVAQATLAFGFPPVAPDDVKYSRALQGGALHDAGAYCLKMARFHLPSDPVAIWASEERAGREVDVRGSATVAFEDGAVAQLAWGFDNDYRNETRIWGATGAYEIDRSFSIPPERTPSVTLIRNTVPSAIEVAPMNHFVALVEDFVRRAEAGRIEEARRELAVQAVMMEGARRSAASGEVIRFATLPGWPLAGA